MTESAHRVAFALEGKREGVEITPATIGFAQFNRTNHDENLWVAVEKELRGQLFEQGGKNKANMHLTLDDGSDLIVTTTQGFLNTFSEVKVYGTVRVRFKAEQNLQSGELRNAQLLDIRPGRPVFDEETFNRAVEIGTRAWADVPDIGQWVAEQRGAA